MLKTQIADIELMKHRMGTKEEEIIELKKKLRLKVTLVLYSFLSTLFGKQGNAEKFLIYFVYYQCIQIQSKLDTHLNTVKIIYTS